MSERLLPEIAKQRAEFLRRGMHPAVLLCPFTLRYQLIGEAFDTYRVYVQQHEPGNRIGVMGLRVVFSGDVAQIEVLAGLERQE